MMWSHCIRRKSTRLCYRCCPLLPRSWIDEILWRKADRLFEKAATKFEPATQAYQAYQACKEFLGQARRVCLRPQFMHGFDDPAIQTKLLQLNARINAKRDAITRVLGSLSRMRIGCLRWTLRRTLTSDCEVESRTLTNIAYPKVSSCIMRKPLSQLRKGGQKSIGIQSKNRALEDLLSRSTITSR